MERLFFGMKRNRYYDAPDGLEAGGAFNVIDDDLEDEEEKKRRAGDSNAMTGVAVQTAEATPIADSGSGVKASYLSDDEEERKAQEAAVKDWMAGVKHFDVSEYTKSESNYGGAAKLYSSIDGVTGTTSASELKRLAGLDDSMSWNAYLAKGGSVPAGYEIESRLLAAEEKREGLYWAWKSGQMSESDFLYQAYGKDIMKKNGDDLSSVSYWFKRMDNGYWDSPLDSDSYLQELLSEARAMFEADKKIRSTQEVKVNWSNGQTIDEKTFAEYFGAEFTQEYIDQLGGMAQIQKMYNAGYLSGVVNPFIDANGDGKISDGDWYYHDDGRVYKIGHGCKVTRWDEAGKPVEVVVGNDGAVGGFFKRLFSGLFESVVGIVESFIDLGAMIIDGFANIGDPNHGLKYTTELNTKREAWRNSIKIGDWAVINDNVWSADGQKNTQAVASEVGNVVGNITGMIILTIATAGAGTAVKAGSSAGQTATKAAAETAKQGVKALTKGGAKITKKGLTQTLKQVRQAGQQALSKEGTKFTLKQAQKVLFNTVKESGATMSLAAKAAVGTKVGIAQVGRGVARTVNAFTHFGSGYINLGNGTGVARNVIAKTWAQSALSAAVLTSRDIVDNISRSSAINSTLIDPETGEKLDGWRSDGEIVGQAFAFGAINWAISTVFRATWDDVGLTGRLATFSPAMRKASSEAGEIVTKTTSPIWSAMFKLGNTGSRWGSLIDTLADSAEYVFTNVNNSVMQNGGFGNANYGNALREFLSNPASLIGLGYSSYATYAGSIGRSNYGVEHRAGDFLNKDFNSLASDMQKAYAEKSKEIKNITDPIARKQAEDTLSELSKITSQLFTAQNVNQDGGDSIPSIFMDYDQKGKVGYVYDADGRFHIVREGEEGSAQYLDKITYLKANGKKGTTYALKPGEGELAITAFPSMGMKIIGGYRALLLADGFKDSKGNSLVDGIKLDFIDRNLIRARIEQSQTMFKTLGAYQQSQKILSSMLQTQDGQLKFFERLKERHEIMKNSYSYLYKGKKWAHLLKDLDTEAMDARWNDIFTNPEKLFRTSFAYGDSFKQTQKKYDEQFDKYFIRREPITDFAQKMLRYNEETGKYEIDPTKKTDMQDDWAIITAAAKHLNEDESPEVLANASFVVVKNPDEMSDIWNADGVQTKQAEIKRQIELLKQLTATNDVDVEDKVRFGNQGGFVVFDSEPDSNGKTHTVIMIKQGMSEMEMARNNMFFSDAMTYLQMITDPDLSINEKRDAILGLIEVFVPNAKEDWDKITSSDTKEKIEEYTILNKTRALAIIDPALGHKVIPSSTALELTNIFDVNEIDFSKGKFTDINFSNVEQMLKFEKEKNSLIADAQRLDKKNKENLSPKEYDERLVKFVDKAKKFVSDYGSENSKAKELGFISDEGGLLTKKSFDKIKKATDENDWDFYLSQATKRGSVLGKRLENLDAKEAKKVISKLFKDLGIKNFAAGIHSIKKNESELFFEAKSKVTAEDVDNAKNVARNIKEKLEENLDFYNIHGDIRILNDPELEDLHSRLTTFIETGKVEDYAKLLDYFKENVLNQENKNDLTIILNKKVGDKDTVEYYHIQDIYWGMQEFKYTFQPNAKRSLLKEAFAKYPELNDYLDPASLSKVQRMASDPSVDYKTFKDELKYIASTESLIDRYVAAAVDYSTVLKQTQDIRKSDLCVINLANFMSKYQQTLQMQADINVSNRLRDKDTIANTAASVGGLARVASAAINLGDIMIMRKGEPYLIFDFSKPDELAKCRNFLEQFGYEKLSIEDIQGIDGVEYRPNDDNGWVIESDYDVVDTHDFLETETTTRSGDVNLDKKTAIYNISLNEFVIDENSRFNIDTLIFALNEANGGARIYNGEIESSYDKHIKSGKVGGKASQSFSVRTRSLSAYMTKEEESNMQTLEIMFALKQAYDYTAAFFDGGYEQAREYTQITDASRIETLSKLGFEITDDGHVVGFKAGDKDTSEYARNAILIMKSHPENPLKYVLPFNDDVLSRLESTNLERFNIIGLGRNLVDDQNTFSSKYDNYIAAQMNDGILNTDGTGINPFATLMSLATKDGGELLKGSVTFNKLTIPADIDTIGKLEAYLNQGKYRNNFYAQQLLGQVQALKQLQNYNSESQYKFLADEQIRNAIIDNSDKTPEEIAAIIKKLEYKEPTSKEYTIREFSDMYDATFHDIGDEQDRPGVNSKTYRALGIKSDKDTFNSLKDMANAEAIANLLNKSVINMQSIADAVTIAKANENNNNAVSAILYRTREVYTDINGNKKVRYNISIDDIAGLTKSQVDELVNRLGDKASEITKPIDDNTDSPYDIIQRIINTDTEGEFVDYVETRGEIPANVSAPSRQGGILELKGREHNEALRARAHNAAIRASKKRTMKKMSSLHNQQNIFGRLLNERLDSKSITTNSGSRMMYDMNNAYQSARFLTSYISLTKDLSETIMQHGIHKKADVEDFTIRILASTTGVSSSDGYFGTFFFNQEGNKLTMSDAVRTSAYRDDDNIDTLYEYFKLNPDSDADKRKTKFIVTLDKNYAVESGKIKYITVDNDMHTRLRDALINKAVMRKRANETEIEWIERQYPHLKLIRDVRDRVIAETNLPKEVVSIIMPTAVDIANSYKTEGVNLATEAMLNAVVRFAGSNYDKFLKEADAPHVSREDFQMEVNDQIKRLNEALKFGISNDYVPAEIKGIISNMANEICNAEDIKKYRNIKNGVSQILPFTSNEDKVNLIKAMLLTSEDGASRSATIRALGGYDLPDGDIKKVYDGYDKLKAFEKEGYVIFDTEYIRDNDGNQTLVEISLTKVEARPDEKTPGNISKTIKITLDSGLSEEDPTAEARHSNFRIDMVAKLMSDGISKEKANAHVDNLIYSKLNVPTDTTVDLSELATDTTGYISKLFKKEFAGVSNFITFNGTMKGADLDMVAATPELEELVKMIQKGKHLDAYRDLVLQVIPNVPDTKINYSEMSNVSLARQLGIETSGEHESDSDNKITISVLNKMFAEEPISFKSQRDIIYNEIGKLLDIDMSEAGWKKEVKKLYNAAIKQIKDASASIKKSKYTNDFIERLNNYKGQTNLDTRKVFDAVNALRISQDQKTYRRLVDSTIEGAITARLKERLDAIVPHYEDARKLYAYVSYSDNEYEFYDRANAAFQAIADMYGNKYPGAKQNTISATDLLHGLELVVANGEQEDFLARVNTILHTSLSVNDMNETKRTFDDLAKMIGHLAQQREDFKDSTDDFHKKFNSIRLAKQTSRLTDEISISFKTLPLAETIKGSKLYDIDKETAMDLMRFNIAQSNHFVDDNEPIDFIDNLYMESSDVLDSLKEIIVSQPNITRSYSKAVAIPSGKEIIDVVGRKHIMNSDTVIINKDTFKDIFGTDYETYYVDNLKLTNDDVYVMVERQPADKADVVHPHKLVVVDDKTQITGVTQLDMFSRMAGDFDGDSLVVYKSTPTQSELYKQLLLSGSGDDGTTIDPYLALDKIIEQGYTKLKKAKTNQEYSDIVDGITDKELIEFTQKQIKYLIDGGTIGFGERYNEAVSAIRNKISEKFTSTKRGYDIKKVQDEIIDALFLKRNQVGPNTYTYIYKNMNVSLGKKYDKFLKELNLEARGHSAVQKRDSEPEAALTGYAEYSFLLDKNSTSAIKFDEDMELRYRPITLNKQLEMLARLGYDGDDFDTFMMELLNRESLYNNNKTAWFNKQETKAEMKEVWKETINKRKAQYAALEIYKNFNDFYNRSMPKLERGDNIVRSEIALDIVNNILKNAESKVKTKEPNGIGDKYIFYPVSVDYDGVSGANSRGDEHIIQWKKGASYAHEFSVTVNDSYRFKEGDVIKKGKTIGGKVLPQDATVVEILPEGRIILVSTQKGLNQGTKVLDNWTLRGKNIVNDEDADVERRAIYEQFAKDNKIKDREIFGYSNEVQSFSKMSKIPDSDRIKKVYDKKGNLIAVAIKDKISVIEDTSNIGSHTDDSYVDAYTVLNSLGSADGLMFAGGYFVRESFDIKSDTHETGLDTELTRAARSISRNTFDDMVGRADGTELYQRNAIFQLLELASRSGKMTDDEYRNEIKFLKSSAAANKEGLIKIVELFQKYFPDGLPEKLTETQKVLLSKELLFQVAGTAYTGIDANNKEGLSDTRTSKSRIQESLPMDVGTMSLGETLTTLNKALQSNGYLKKRGISTLELINILSNANSRGIINDAQALAFNNKKARRRIEDAQDTTTIYGDSSKFGVAGPPKQEQLGYAKPIFEEDDAIKLSDSDFTKWMSNRYNEKEDGSIQDKNIYYSRPQKWKNIFDLLNGEAETIYDRATAIHSTAKTSAHIPEVSRRLDFMDNDDFGIIDNHNFNNYTDDDSFNTTKRTLSELKQKVESREGYKNPFMARAHSDNILTKDMESALEKSDFKSKEKEYMSSIEQEAEEIRNAFNSNESNRQKIFKDSVSSEAKIGNARYFNKNKFEDTDVSNDVKKDSLYAYGMSYNDSQTAEAMAELRRVTPDNLNTPGIVNDYNVRTQETMFNAARQEQDIRVAMELEQITEFDVSRYATIRGAVDEIDANENGTQTKHSVTELTGILKDFEFNTVDEARAFLKDFENRNPLTTTKTIKLITNLTQIIKEVNKATNTPFNSFSLLLTMKPSTDEGKKSRLTDTIKQLFSRSKRVDQRIGYEDGEVYSNVYSVVGNGIVDFFDNIRCLTNDLARQQSIIRMANKLPLNRRIVADLMNNYLYEDMKDGESKLGEFSKFEIRQYQLGEIARRLGITLPATKDASADFRNALKAIDALRIDALDKLGMDHRTSYNDLVSMSNSTKRTELVERAIQATEAQWEIYHSIVVTSPKVRDDIIKTLKTIENSNHALVDKWGRKIKTTMTKDGDIKVLRKPLGAFDISYIRDAYTDNFNNRNDYEITLCIRALAGDVYVANKLLADKLDQHVFTKEIPGGMKKILQETSRFVSKVLMSQPLKIMRRLMQFSLYDFNMAMTANPWTFKELPSAKKELSAFFQSKGAVCSPELRDYLEHQGFRYSDIKGYDPVQMEGTDSHSIADSLYFDKVNNMFSQQNLFIRYALYRAEKKSFDEGKGWYGVMYHKKDVIDGMKDSGNKAMAVIDATLGGPGGFSELSKTLGKNGFVFTTFPLAVARWAKEGASTAKAVLTNIGETGFGDAWKHLGSPIVAMGATYGITYAITMWLAQLFGVDEEDAKEMAKNQEFIDPFQTIWNNGIVTVSDNSVFQLQALIDSFDSFKEQKGFGNQILGFVNDNFLSHINPILKGLGESAIKKDFIGSSTIENDRSFFENVERKALGYFIGSAGAAAYLNGREEPNSTLSGRISNAIAAELGNTKAYKSDKKSYQKALSTVNGYLSDFYKQNGSTYGETSYNQSNVYALTKEIKTAITNGKPMEYIIDLCERASQKGYSKYEIASSIKACSVKGKLEKLEELGRADDFYSGLTESQKNVINKALAFEDAYFPYADDLLGESQSTHREYYGTGYLPHIYLSNNYVQRPSSKKFYTVSNQKPFYFNNAKTYSGVDMPNIRKLFINKLTNSTGNKAITIADLIGEYWDNYYSDYKGSIIGEAYKEHWNGKPGQTDWRN